MEIVSQVILGVVLIVTILCMFRTMSKTDAHYKKLIDDAVRCHKSLVEKTAELEAANYELRKLNSKLDDATTSCIMLEIENKKLSDILGIENDKLR